jgi:predicted RNase H-like nuclease (RuvC/YqgF family)
MGTQHWVSILIALCTTVLSILGIVNAYIMQSLRNEVAELRAEMKSIQDDIKQLQSKDDCSRARAACQKVLDREVEKGDKALEDLWEAFSHHGHAEGKVTR